MGSTSIGCKGSDSCGLEMRKEMIGIDVVTWNGDFGHTSEDVGHT